MKTSGLKPEHQENVIARSFNKEYNPINVVAKTYNKELI